MRKSSYCALSVAVVTALTFATPSKADTYAYELASEFYFGKIDLTTGVYTSINGSGLGVGLSGLANYGGKIYGGADGGEGLYSVNPSTGVATLVGNASLSGGYAETGSTTSGLYGLGFDDNLYKINPTTGASTLIGATGVPLGGVIGMSANGPFLYYNQDTSLYQINTTTGVGTFVGNLGVTFGAMVDIGGVWYGGGWGVPQVYTFNPSTAVTTAGALVSGTSDQFWGLTPSPVPTGVPEPSIWAMTLLGFAGLGVAARASRRWPALG